MENVKYKIQLFFIIKKKYISLTLLSPMIGFQSPQTK